MIKINMHGMTPNSNQRLRQPVAVFLIASQWKKKHAFSSRALVQTRRTESPQNRPWYRVTLIAEALK